MIRSVFNRQVVAVGVGDFKIATDGFTIETILGCCVGVCLYDNEKKVGGLLHIMLPKAPKGKASKPAKYADTGIKEMLRLMEKDYNVIKTDLIAKIFGGAQMKTGSSYDIGHQNAQKVKEILRKNEIELINEKTGGQHGYKIEFDISSGIVRCRVFGYDEEEF